MRHSTESETIVIGSVFLDPSLFTTATDAGLSRDSFSPGLHSRIWEAITYFSDKGEDLYELQIASYIDSQGFPCTFTDITAITDRVETTTAFEHSLSRLRELERLDALTRNLTAACDAVKQPEYDWSDMVDKVQPFVTASEGILTTSGEASGKEDCQSVLSSVDNMIQGKADDRKFIKSGIAVIDEQAKGYASTELVIIAARPSRGKTALLNQCTVANLMIGKTIAIFSLEMSRKEIIECLASIKSQVNAWSLENDLYEKQMKYRRAVEWVMDLIDRQLFIYDATTIRTIQQIQSRCKALTQKVGGLDMIGVDYAQIVQTTKDHYKTNDRIAEVSMGLKLLRIQSKCTVVALAQLNRDTERENRIPRISDLGASGQLEQDGDCILLNHRPSKSWQPDSKSFDGPVDQTQFGLLEYDHLLSIAKRRKGPTIDCPARFVPSVTTFHPVR